VENEPAARMVILRDFQNSFPNDPATLWILDQQRELYLKSGQETEALGVAERMLALDPDMRLAFETLKMAEKQREPEVFSHWRKVVEKVAIQAGSILSPEVEPERAGRAETARQILKYLEYLDYKDLLASSGAARLRSCDRFQEKHPGSPYRRDAQRLKFSALLETGHEAEAAEFARSLLEEQPDDAELLVAAAEYYFRKGVSENQVLGWSNHAIEVLSAGGEPKRVDLLTRASWMSGRILADRGRFQDADRALRVTLAGLGNDSSITAAALFYLGWVNYRMGHFDEAIRFNRRCVAMRSSYQAAAGRNLRVIEAERGAR